MELIPYNFYNHILVNAKYHVFNLNKDFRIKFSFYEYVKSQMHFPLVVYLNNRNPNDYKEVYLFLTSNLDISKPRCMEKIVRYFYRDISNSLINIGVEGDFELDLECLEDCGIEFEELTGSFNEKILKVNKSAVDNDLILWR